MEAVNTHITSIPKVIDGQTAIYFDAMMEEGIKEIEHLARNQWTNYNASDPGITMLEYLSYGLLNLGYKASMPLADLLTGADEKIDPRGRFFTPSEIMFTNPVTINDFRKLLLDRVPTIKNVWIVPAVKYLRIVPLVEYPRIVLPPKCPRVVPPLKSLRIVPPDKYWWTIPCTVPGRYSVTFEMSNNQSMELLIPLKKELTDLMALVGKLECPVKPNKEGRLSTKREADKRLKVSGGACKGLLAALRKRKNSSSRVKYISTKLGQNLEDLASLISPNPSTVSEAKWAKQKEKLLKAFTSLHDKVQSLAKDYRQTPDAIDALLMQHRNLGEYFDKCTIVSKKPIKLSALVSRIYLTPESDINEVLAHLIYVVNNYFSPFIKRHTYPELLAARELTNEILNGPRLTNGYIKDQSLQKERGQWNIVVLSRLIAEVAGIQKVYMNEQEGPKDRKGIYYIDFYDPKLFNGTSIYLGKNEVNASELTRVAQCYSALVKQNVFAGGLPANELYPVMPRGDHRNIQEYYSIQNLFPAFYGLDNARDLTGATSGATAEIKQLKAYLMLFEQIMADHQAQIAGVPDLLGFGKESIEELKQTYLSQGLYNSPGAEVILRAFDGFKQKNSATENNSSLNWDDFINSTSNGYISDLEAIQATDDQQIARKNTFLSHRLATVGEQFDTDNVISLNPNYGNYQQARIKIIDRLLENFPLTSENIGRSYFFSKDTNKLLLAGLELKLGLLYSLNGYYQNLIDLIVKLPERHCEVLPVQETNERVFICTSTIQLLLRNQNWVLAYQGTDIVKIPAVAPTDKAKNNDSTEGLKLMKEFGLTLRCLMLQTKGFVFIDSIMLNKSHFMNHGEKTDQKLLDIGLYLPQEVIRVTRPDFVSMLSATLFQEGPMTTQYQISSLDYHKISKLLKARRDWLSGILVLQHIRLDADSVKKNEELLKPCLDNQGKRGDDQKVLAKAAKAVGKIKAILKQATLLKNCDAQT